MMMEEEKEKEAQGEPRPRAESAAARREAREQQKERRQAADARRAASNRFSLSPARKATPDTIRGGGTDPDVHSGGDDAQAINGDNNEGGDEEEDRDEKKDADGALLVTTALRRLRAKNGKAPIVLDENAALDGHRHWRFTMRALPLGFNSAAHSRLVTEKQERRTAGLFTRDRHVPAASLVRLEQRLRREEEYSKEKIGAGANVGSNTSTNNQHDAENDGLEKLLTLLGDCDDDGDSSDTDTESSRALVTPSKMIDSDQSTAHPMPSAQLRAAPTPQRRRQLAWLQLTVARVELDDHLLFTLSDRARAQFRALVGAYASQQRQRDWELPLRRIDAFVAQAVDPIAPSSLAGSAARLSTSQWSKEVRRDAERALLSLHSLQQLHSQVIVKWDELRALEASEVDHNGADGGASSSFISRFVLHVRKRATPIDLDGVQALLELLFVGSEARKVGLDDGGSMPSAHEARDRGDEMNALLSSRLRGVLAAGAEGALTTVLELRRHSSSPVPPVERGHRANLLAPPPQISVAIYVNGRLACRTRARPWDSLRSRLDDSIDSGNTSMLAMAGVVTLNETFRLRLPRFPASVTVRVLESRPLRSWLPVSLLSWSDEPLSAHPVPIIVPGNDEARAASSRACGQFDPTGLPSAQGDDSVWIPAASIGASHEWYQFSAAADLPRARWHRSMQNVPALADCARRVQGRVVVSAAWIPTTSGGGGNQGNARSDGGIAYLPPAVTAVVIKSSSQESSSPMSEGVFVPPFRRWATPQLVGRSCSNQRSERVAGFTMGRDFKRHVTPEELAVDVNDPADARVVRVQRSIMADRAFSPLITDVFRCFPDRATLTDSLPLTKRNQLLRLRDRERRFDGTAERSGSREQQQLSANRAVLLQEPVPLLDAEILANEAYLRLLRPELRAFDRELLCERAGLSNGSDDTSDQWSVRGRYERQRLALLAFLDRVDVAARRFSSDYASSFTVRDLAGPHSSSRSLALASIVQEQPLPLFPGSFELPALGALFAPRRRLRPRATSRRPASAASTAASSAHWPMHCELYVQVQRASNVPLRVKPRHANGGGGAGGADPLTPRRLRRQKAATRRLTSVDRDGEQEASAADAIETPRAARFDLESRVFVEVSFQGRTRRTTCCLVSVTSSGANGASAEWMETLVLPFQAPKDDWNPVALTKVRDTVCLRLYDRVVRAEASEDADIGAKSKDASANAGVRTGKRAIHEEHCLLGSLEVPFATLYGAQGLVNAPMRCVTPVEHLGYANVRQGERTGGSDFHSAFASSTTSSAGVDNQRREHEVDDGVDDEGEEGEEGDEAYRVVRRSERDATYLHVMMTLSPILPPPPVPPTPPASNPSAASGAAVQSPDVVLRNTVQWANGLGVRASVVVSLLGHGPALVTQLLVAQRPPPEMSTVPEVVHFVRCIPLVGCWQRALLTSGDVEDSGVDSDRQSAVDASLIAGDLDREKAKRVWASSQECLDLCAGDRYEHAVLLHNYLAWCDLQRVGDRDPGDVNRKSVFLVFGSAITNGDDAVFVLWRPPNASHNGGVLWDATTGVGCLIGSEHCPLRQVTLAASSDNVFVNIQRLHPAVHHFHRDQFNWDIDGSARCWRPLFGARSLSLDDRALLPRLQPHDLHYAPTPPEYPVSVERELHDALKFAVRRWRSAHSTTVFSLNASLKVRAHLELLEQQQALGVDVASLISSGQSGSGSKRLKVKNRHGGLADQAKASAGFLLELQRTHEVTGSPVHVGFTDIPSVVRMVKDMVRHGLSSNSMVHLRGRCARS
jgi:hypothetical protein